jgi:5-epi-alpha-selinene synthase
MENSGVETDTLPQLYYPFSPVISPHAEAIHENTLGWLGRFDVFDEDAAYSAFYSSHIGRLAARFHPDAPQDALQLVSDWYAWMFLKDDQRDESDFGKHPELLAAANNRYLEILKGADPRVSEQPLLYALKDLRQRLVAKAPTDLWMRRFTRSVAEHFTSTVWEATNRSRRLNPDLKSYVRMRPITGGLYVDTEFIGITERTHVPPEVREHPDVGALMRASNNVVCWANDLFSLEKEAKRGDVHNIVLVLQHERGLSLRSAVAEVVAMHNAQVREFERAEPRIPSFGRAVNTNLSRFVSVLKTRMRGNFDWSQESGRYGSHQSLVARTCKDEEL